MAIPIVRTEDYDYDLPQERVAQYPLDERDESKLLVYNQAFFCDDQYKHLSDYIPEHSMMVFNNSKVIPARLLFVKETSGIIELFCLEPMEGTPYEALQHQGQTTWVCMIGGLKKWKSDSTLTWTLDEATNHVLHAQKLADTPNGHHISFTWTQKEKTFAEILEQLGQMPIPPYLMRKSTSIDAERYQTTYASVEGSVAAPTAGLHFTPSIFEKLAAKQIKRCFTTLHVGAGTFKPVSNEFAHEHNMHAEWIEADLDLIEQLAQYDHITAVGTTSLRTLESLYWFAQVQKNTLLSDEQFILPQFIAYKHVAERTRKETFLHLAIQMKANNINKLIFKTALMILPGYKMKVANKLVTNFHQPKSTLLMLVNAFTKGNWKQIYDHALKNDYRFLSYGDGCLLSWS